MRKRGSCYDISMKLTVLGSGICIIGTERKGPSFLLDCDGTALLFDCGWGFGENFMKAGYDLQALDHVFISHPHADHMGSLMHILQSMYVASNFYPETKGRTKPLHLHGYKGFSKDYETLRSIMFPERLESYEIKLFEYQNDQQVFGDVKIAGHEVKHRPDIFHAAGYKVEYNGKVFMYSGDTSFDEKPLTYLAKDADLAIFEASNKPESYTKNGPISNHLSAYEAGVLAQKANVKKLGLFHLYDIDEQVIKKEVGKNFKDELLILEDLQIIEL